MDHDKGKSLAGDFVVDFKTVGSAVHRMILAFKTFKPFNRCAPFKPSERVLLQLVGRLERIERFERLEPDFNPVFAAAPV